MKKLCLCLALVSLLGLGGQAFAAIGTIDAVPAATLLIPYFEVDTVQGGINTLFSVNNASATAILAHVTVWSDQSVPVLDFDIYLTGYDVQTVSLYDVLVNGNVPVTASAGQDDSKDSISPKGVVSQDINFASCSTFPYPRPFLSAAFRAHLNAWLQGNASPAIPGNQCAGSKKKDGILRGYVTVDTVNACNTILPPDWTAYFPFLTYQNVLWGDVFYVNPDENFAQGDTAVHIEACTTCFTPGVSHTFYGRYDTLATPDAREPLPTTMAGRFVSGGGFDGGTDFLVWREANALAGSYSCNNQGPSWYPLTSTQIVIFDEQEHPVTSEECPSGDPTCTQTILIPNEANRIDPAVDLLSPFAFGWAYLNLQHVNTAYPDNYAQMWLTVTMDAEGRYSVGYSGIQLDNANAPITTLIPVP